MSRARETLWVLGLNGLQIAASALSFVRLARALDPTGYGVFAFAMTVGSFLPLIAGLGADHVLIMKASRAIDDLGALLGNATLIRVVSSVLLFAGVLAAAALMDSGGATVLLLVSASSLLTAFAQPLFASYYRVVGRPRFTWAVLAFGQIVFCALLYWPSVRLTVVVASWFYFATSLLVVAVLSVDVRRSIRMHVEMPRLRSNLGLGLYFSGSQFVDLAFQRTDILLLQVLLGAGAVGTYSAGNKFITILLTIPAALHIVYLPEFHRIAGNDATAELRVAFLRMRSVLMEVSAGLLGLLVTNSSRVVEVFLTSRYAAASIVIAVGSVGTFITFATYPYSMLSEAMGLVAHRLWLRCAATVVTAVAIWAFVVGEGIKGAALGVTIGTAVFLALLHWLTRPANGGVRALIRDCRPLVAVVVAGGIVVGARPIFGDGWPGLIWSSLAFGLLFLTVGTLLNVLPLLDLRKLYRTAILWGAARSRREQLPIQ